MPDLFALQLETWLAPGAACSFLAQGNVRLNYDTTTKLWSYTLNYTGNPCSLYGGITLEDAMRNVTPGFWMKAGPYHQNCAYYIVVGNADKVNRNSFTF